MNKEKFRGKLKELILTYPPEIAVWGNIFTLQEQGKYEEAEKLRKEYFGPKKRGFTQYVKDFFEEHIYKPKYKLTK